MILPVRRIINTKTGEKQDFYAEVTPTRDQWRAAFLLVQSALAAKGDFVVKEHKCSIPAE